MHYEYFKPVFTKQIMYYGIIIGATLLILIAKNSIWFTLRSKDIILIQVFFVKWKCAFIYGTYINVSLLVSNKNESTHLDRT